MAIWNIKRNFFQIRQHKALVIFAMKISITEFQKTILVFKKTKLYAEITKLNSW